MSTLAPPVSHTVAPFEWRDGERTIIFGHGAITGAVAAIAPGFALLTTPRASTMVPQLAMRASAVHDVPAGRVDEIAAALRSHVGGNTLVALGGGRVIDVAKSLAAADPPRRVIAIPTTLSGAEMTAIHRHATGVASDTPKVRPAHVIIDPGLSASQPLADLAASAANALGHAVEGPLTPSASPVPTLAATESIRLIGEAFASDPPDRDRLALAALLAGYTIDTTGYGLHHVLSQTLVRFAGVGHGPANAAMLPHSLGALGQRFPEHIGRDVAGLATRLAQLGGATRLRDLSVPESALADLAATAADRPELALTPPAATRDELYGIYARAW